MLDRVVVTVVLSPFVVGPTEVVVVMLDRVAVTVVLSPFVVVPTEVVVVMLDRVVVTVVLSPFVVVPTEVGVGVVLVVVASRSLVVETPGGVVETDRRLVLDVEFVIPLSN